MKIKSILLMLLVVSLLSSPLALATFMPSTASLQVTMINQNPDPVRPGEYVDVKFRVVNNGQTAARNVKVELIPAYPFSLDPGVIAVREISTVDILQRDSAGVVLDYTVRVASDAVLGRNKLTLRYSFDGSAYVSKDFMIDVRERDSGISIVGVSSKPLVQGSPGTIDIAIQNPSDLNLRDITVQLGLDNEALPLAPYESATTKKLALLRPNEVNTFSFGVVPYSDAPAGVYRIPVTISYFGSENEVVEKRDLIGILIGSEPEVSITIDSTDFAKESSRGRIIVYFVNRGLSDIRFLNMKVMNTDDYQVVSNNEIYVGLVSSDDFETADFSLLRLNDENPFDVKIAYQYRDANNKLYEGEMIVPVTLHNSNNGGRGGFGWILLLIIIGGGYWYYKKRKKR